MKTLDTSSITDSAQMPIKKGTLDFLQLAYKEGIDSIIKSMIGTAYDSTKLYILYGADINLIAGTIEDGAAFYNGEFYLIVAGNVAYPSGSTAYYWQILQSQYGLPEFPDADPVTFTDNTPRNVHNIKTIFLGGLANSTGSIALRLEEIKIKSIGDAVLTYGDQAISGLKTFSSQPICSLAPIASSHLTNKTYVDSKRMGGRTAVFDPGASDNNKVITGEVSHPNMAVVVNGNGFGGDTTTSFVTVTHPSIGSHSVVYSIERPSGVGDFNTTTVLEDVTATSFSVRVGETNGAVTNSYRLNYIINIF